MRLRLTDVLLFLLLLLFGWHEWANRSPAGRYVRYEAGRDQIALLDTATGRVYVREIRGDEEHRFTIDPVRGAAVGPARAQPQSTARRTSYGKTTAFDRTMEAISDAMLWQPAWWPKSWAWASPVGIAFFAFMGLLVAYGLYRVVLLVFHRVYGHKSRQVRA